MSNLKALPKTHIRHFKDFKRVCKINDHCGQWIYSNIDESVMYAEHTSWVYCITVNGVIYKIGASGVPLGIRRPDGQPKKGTECRLGRYRNHRGTYTYDTDEYCRNELRSTVINPKNLVEFWAYKCPIVRKKLVMAGEKICVASEIHWPLEKALINQFEKFTGSIPKLNKVKA
jgi:hypothetical protein